jgi:hypothetical protein
MLKKVWAPAVTLLQALQEAAERKCDSGAWDNSLIWLAGGALRAAHAGVVPRDLDFICVNDHIRTVLLGYISGHFNCKLIDDNVRTTKLKVTIDGQTVALVDFGKTHHATPFDTARWVDFVCCAGAVSTTTYARHVRFESDIAARVLEVNAPPIPQASLVRMERYLKNGWTISDEARAHLVNLAAAPGPPEWDFENMGEG